MLSGFELYPRWVPLIESLFTAEAGRAQALADLMERQHGGKKSIPLSSKLQMELILSNISSHISSPTLFLDRERDRYTCDEAVYIWLLLKGQCQFVRKEISVELKKLINQTYKQIGVKGRGRSDNPGGVLNKVLYRETSPQGPTPYLFIYHF